MQKIIYYTITKMMSFNALFNLIIGGRGIGKTFALKEYLLKRFLNKKEPFIYLRRHQTELDELDKDNFFKSDLLKKVFKNFELINMETTPRMTTITFTCSNKGYEDQENKIIISSKKVYLNKEVVCYMKSLSTWLNLRGSEYDEIYNILFDEVLIPKTAKKSRKYLDNEVENLINLMFSIFRNRPNVHIYLLSNVGDYNNPYFSYFNFKGNNDKEFWFLKEKECLIQFPDENAFIDEKGEEIQSPMHKLIKGSKIYDYMTSSAFTETGDENIIKMKGLKVRLYSIYCDGDIFTLYRQNNVIYIAKGYDKNMEVYTFELSNVEYGYTFIPKSSNMYKAIKKQYYNNTIFYDDIVTKQKILKDLKIY